MTLHPILAFDQVIEEYRDCLRAPPVLKACH
jgi:hypothetical protein